MSNFAANRYYKLARILLILLLLTGIYFLSSKGTGVKLGVKLAPADIYFIGDASMCDLALQSSVVSENSLPSYFSSLLSSGLGQQKSVQSLAKIRVDRAYLQRVFAALPDESTVFYRAGLKLQKDSFLMNLLISSLSGLLPFFFDEYTALKSELTKLIQSKKLRVFYLDYTTSRPMEAYTGLVSGMRHVPLVNLMKESGFFYQASIDRRLLLDSGKTLNNIGLHVEAILLYNYCCSQKLFDLQPANTISMAHSLNLTADKQARYQELKALFRQMKAADITNKLAFPSLIIPEILALNTLLQETAQNNNSETVTKEIFYEGVLLERLALLVFQEPTQIISGITRQLQEFNLAKTPIDMDTLTLYYAVLAARLGLVYDFRSDQYERIFQKPFPLLPQQISVLNLNKPFPLELCGRFVQESGFSPEQLSSKEALEYFFSASWNEFLFTLKTPIRCNLM